MSSRAIILLLASIPFFAFGNVKAEPKDVLRGIVASHLANRQAMVCLSCDYKIVIGLTNSKRIEWNTPLAEQFDIPGKWLKDNDKVRLELVKDVGSIPQHTVPGQKYIRIAFIPHILLGDTSYQFYASLFGIAELHAPDTPPLQVQLTPVDMGWMGPEHNDFLASQINSFLDKKGTVCRVIGKVTQHGRDLFSIECDEDNKTYKYFLDPEKAYFPVEFSLHDSTGTIASGSVLAMKQLDSGAWFPTQSLLIRSKNNDQKEVYKFITESVRSHDQLSPKDFCITIPVGVKVNNLSQGLATFKLEENMVICLSELPEMAKSNERVSEKLVSRKTGVVFWAVTISIFILLVLFWRRYRQNSISPQAQ